MTTYNRERQIDVQRSSQNVVDTEFDSMRGRFENEMRRVEAEMARLRQEFEGALCGVFLCYVCLCTVERKESTGGMLCV